MSSRHLHRLILKPAGPTRSSDGNYHRQHVHGARRRRRPAVGNWHFPYYNEEMGRAVDRTHDADVMLFGRVTYDSFAGAWPGREAAGGDDAAFAKRLGDVRKIVA